MSRDPRCLFAYWELGGRGRQDAERRYGLAELEADRWVLRVECCCDDRRGLRFFDVAVDPSAGSWYLHVEQATSYRVRIGVVLSSGRFVEFAASCLVVTPPESVSCMTDGRWQMTREESERLLAGTLDGGPGGSSQAVRGLSRMDLTSWKG